MAETYSKYSKLFTPIKINGVDFKNRFILAPPSPNLAAPDGKVTHQFVDWFRMFAKGGASILYVGNSSIDITECKDEECQLDLSSDSTILPMSWYAEMAQEFGCHASLEVNHNGKDTTFEAVGHLPFSSSPIPGDSEKMRAMMAGREPRVPIEMDQAKIDETVLKYANACRRMQRAGMDVALLHGGHGNLLAQFTSPHYNKRTDKYGGSVENRARFAIEVVEKTRELCGPNFVIDYRISADEIIGDGMHIDETIKLLKILKEHGVDMFNVSAGLHSEGMMAFMSYWLQGYTMDRGYNVHWAQKIKDAFQGDILLTAVGSIVNVDVAEEILDKGYADFVAMCRPLMADPEMPAKAAANKRDEIRPCIRCNACAMRLGGPKVINCAINPISGMTSYLRDMEVPLAKTKKKVAVIGAGPAGLTAVDTLVQRGHEVYLYEKSGEIGGQVLPAAAADVKSDMKDYLKWLQVHHNRIIKDSGQVKLLLNTEATPELIEKEKFDAIIVSVGGEPIIPRSIPGIDKPSVLWAADAQTTYRGKLGKKVLVVGAGDVGIEAALDFADQGIEVEIIDILQRGGGFGGMGSPTSMYNDPNTPKGYYTNQSLNNLLDQKGIKIQWGTGLGEVTDKGAVLKLADGTTKEIEVDQVLLAMGLRPRSDLAESFRHSAPVTSIHIVGDAKAVGGNLSFAINGAFQAALHI
ncbi:MAG: NAD(P)/FAD-dependent oxidoreductase [Oscillospiraceae bacterium]|jgi:2,4-dienoyl-CoA reductase-like NADH-dependent reductase (Old Yellow Enzyme family)/thioredoxin reductase|nr:NAD(P)/FAD-dependent oxidoreductase [Oscillospiraceae bacterium]